MSRFRLNEFIPSQPHIVPCVLDDPTVIRALVTTLGPYWPIQRYYRNRAELQATVLETKENAEADDATATQTVRPWFRQDWLTSTTPLICEAVRILTDNPALISAAEALLDSPVILTSAYVNLTPPCRGVDAGHLDIPAFVGLNRDTAPTWLVAAMLRSGLFERWYIPAATAVCWYYDGPGGGFSYWPNGRAKPAVHRPAISNTAIVADADRMFHRVRNVDPANAKPIDGLTLDSQLLWHDEAWRVMNDGRELAAFTYPQVRISVTCKYRALVDDAVEPLTKGEAIRILAEGLGLHTSLDRVADASELADDAAFVTAVNDALQE